MVGCEGREGYLVLAVVRATSSFGPLVDNVTNIREIAVSTVEEKADSWKQ